jgi:hypothetical protein
MGRPSGWQQPTTMMMAATPSTRRLVVWPPPRRGLSILSRQYPRTAALTERRGRAPLPGPARPRPAAVGPPGTRRPPLPFREPGPERWVAPLLPPDRQVAGARTLQVAVVGPPNAGKSTLLNRLVGEKVSIVSPKAQTTQRRITGVWTEGATQLVRAAAPTPTCAATHTRPTGWHGGVGAPRPLTNVCARGSLGGGGHARHCACARGQRVRRRALCCLRDDQAH